MKKTTFFLGVIILFISFNGFSQDGSRDLSFGDNGVVITNINDSEDTVIAVDQAPSGRIIVAGNTYDGVDSENFIIAYLEDGSIDFSFGDNGILINESIIGGVKEVFAQDDEKIVVGKGYNSGFRLFRYLEDGSIDTSFGIDGELSILLTGEISRTIELTPQGKFLVCGEKTDGSLLLKRFLLNGQIDTSFGINGSISHNFGGQFNKSNGSVQLMENGSFVVVVRIDDYEEDSNILVRFKEDGSLDTTFGDSGVVMVPLGEEFTCTPLVFPDGGVLASCQFLDFNLDKYLFTIIKFQSNGIVDTTFGNNGYLGGSYAEFIQENQRIIHSLRGYDWEGGLYIGLKRTFANGTLDSSFDFDGNNITLGSANVLSLNGGKIMLAGSNIWYDWPVNIILQQFNNSPLGISDFKLNNVSIYPNPSKNIFTIKHDLINDEISYQVSDIVGKIIQTGTMDAVQTNIDLSKMQTGMYFLTIEGNSYRLLKQ